MTKTKIRRAIAVKVCRSCGKPKRDCVLPCERATSALTEDERFVQWLAHVYQRLDAESDRLDPERKRPGGAVACLDNAAKSLATAIFYLSGRHVSEHLHQRSVAELAALARAALSKNSEVT